MNYSNLRNKNWSLNKEVKRPKVIVQTILFLLLCNNMKALMINNVINTGLDDLVYSYSENVCVHLYLHDL